MRGRLGVKDATGKNGYATLFNTLLVEDKRNNANPALFSVGLQNVPKNRYHDIVPFNETRVKLPALDDYINASHMPVGDHSLLGCALTLSARSLHPAVPTLFARKAPPSTQPGTFGR